MILYFPNEYSNYWQKIYSDDDKICLFSIAPQIRSRINKQIMSNNKVTAISYLNSQLKTYIENDLKNFGILQKYTEEVSLLTVSEFETLKSSNFIVPLKDFWLIPDASESNKLYFPYAFHLISGTDYYWNSKGVALKVIINRRILSDDLRTTELNKILPSIEQVFNDK